MAVPKSIYKDITLSATVTGAPPPSALDDSGRATDAQESVITIADAEAAEADAIANGTATVTSFQLTTSGGNVSSVALPGTNAAAQAQVNAAAQAAGSIVTSTANAAATAAASLAAAQALTNPPVVDIEIPDIEIDEPELNIEDNIEVYAPEERLPLNLYGDMNRGAGAGRK